MTDIEAIELVQGMILASPDTIDEAQRSALARVATLATAHAAVQSELTSTLATADALKEALTMIGITQRPDGLWTHLSMDNREVEHQTVQGAAAALWRDHVTLMTK